MYEDSWIKLCRQIQETWIWGEKPFSKGQAWIDLMLLASGSSGDQQIGMVLTSGRKLSERWGWGKDKTINFLKTLESSQMISVEKDYKCTRIIILNNGNLGFIEKDHQTQKPTQNQTQFDRLHQGFSGTLPDKSPDTETDTKMTMKKRRFGPEMKAIMESWNQLKKYDIISISTIKEPPTRCNRVISIIEKHGVDNAIAAIERIKNSDFLLGKTNEWRIWFDWFIKPDNFIKVFEGNYDDRKEVPRNGEFRKATKKYDDRIIEQ